MSSVAKAYDAKGQAQSDKSLPVAVFGKEPNLSVIHEAVLRELSNGRSGSANTKTRSEVRGGGKKPWKQKGTGRARAGSTRSPLWRGGGVIFGPKPRKFTKDMPKKVRRLASASALSQASKDSKVVYVSSFSFLAEAKTKAAYEYFSKLNLVDQKVLVLADWRLPENAQLKLSVRNLPFVRLSLPDSFSVKDVIEADAVLVTDDALAAFEKRLA